MEVPWPYHRCDWITVDSSGSLWNSGKTRISYKRIMKNSTSQLCYRTCFIMLNPPTRSIDASVVFEPFEGNAWGIFFFLSVLMTLFLWFLLKREELEKNSVNFIDALCLVSGVLCQQGIGNYHCQIICFHSIHSFKNEGLYC